MHVVEFLTKNPPNAPYFSEETTAQVRASATDISSYIDSVTGDYSQSEQTTR